MSSFNKNKEYLLNKLMEVTKYSKEIVDIYFNEDLILNKNHPLINSGYVIESKNYYILSNNLKNILRDMLPNANFKFEISQSKLQEDIKLFILENKISPNFPAEYEMFLINIVNDIHKDINLLDMKVEVNFNRNKSISNRKSLFDNYINKYKELNTLIKQLKNYTYFENNFIYTEDISNIEEISQIICNEIDKLMLESKSNEILNKLGKLKNEDKNKKNFIIVSNFLNKNKNPIEKYNVSTQRLGFVNDFKASQDGDRGLFFNYITEEEQELKEDIFNQIKNEFIIKTSKKSELPKEQLCNENDEIANEIDYLSIFINSMEKINSILSQQKLVKLSNANLSNLEQNTLLSDLICFSQVHDLFGKYKDIYFKIDVTQDLKKEYIDISFSKELF